MTVERYAQALYDAVSEVRSEDQDKVIENFARILVESGDSKLLPEIEEAFRTIKNRSEGIKQIEVVTAREHAEILKTVNEQVGKDSDIKYKIDQNLIGGVIVRVDDTLIDGSIKNSLEELKKAMKG
jgi:F-type H+-transporting ATPase subunit delta